MWLTLSSAVRREIQFLGSIAAVVLFAYLLRPKRLATWSDQAGRTKCSSSVRVWLWPSWRRHNWQTYSGTTSCRNPLADLYLQHVYRSRRIYGAARLHHLAYRGIEAPSAERLAVVRLHRASICRWIPRVAHLAGVLLWFGATLDLTGARTWVKAALPPR